MGQLYRAVEVTGARNFALVERVIREPAPGEVRIRVAACGVCHTDVLAGDGLRADPSVPVVPGHEIAGVIDAVGPGVATWQVGDRVGVGFLNGHCGECEPCRRGNFVACRNQQQTGTTVDGGYAEITYARASGLVRLPDGVEPTQVAPLLCAGLTVYSALGKIAARPGGIVAVHGIGGLGHLAVQYAHHLGYRVVAIARGQGKAELATQLGATRYLDSTAEDPGAALQRLGGADAILTTATSGASMAPLVPGLAPGGQLLVLGAASDPIPLSAADLIFGGRSVQGSLTGSAIDNEDNLAFAAQRDIRSHNEVLPLAEAATAYDRMLAGQARFRIVLDTGAGNAAEITGAMSAPANTDAAR